MNSNTASPLPTFAPSHMPPPDQLVASLRSRLTRDDHTFSFLCSKPDVSASIGVSFVGTLRAAALSQRESESLVADSAICSEEAPWKTALDGSPAPFRLHRHISLHLPSAHHGPGAAHSHLEDDRPAHAATNAGTLPRASGPEFSASASRSESSPAFRWSFSSARTGRSSPDPPAA